MGFRVMGLGLKVQHLKSKQVATPLVFHVFDITPLTESPKP